MNFRETTFVAKDDVSRKIVIDPYSMKIQDYNLRIYSRSVNIGRMECALVQLDDKSRHSEACRL